MSGLTLFASAFGLGLIFNAAPGAVFAETLRQGVRGGFRPALLVQLGSLVGDALWAALGLVGIGLLLHEPGLRLPVGLAGVAYLLWLSFDAWRASGIPHAPSPSASTSHANALRAGMLLSVTNPQNVAYWAALGSAMGAVGISEPDPRHYWVFFAGFMASSVVWSFACAWLVARVFRDATTAWKKLAYRACALAFLILALSSLRDSVGVGPRMVSDSIEQKGEKAPFSAVRGPFSGVKSLCSAPVWSRPDRRAGGLLACTRRYAARGCSFAPSGSDLERCLITFRKMAKKADFHGLEGHFRG